MSKWHIDYNPKPIPDRSYDYDIWHEDIDEWCGTAGSVEEARELIAEIEALEAALIDGHPRTGS